MENVLTNLIELSSETFVSLISHEDIDYYAINLEEMEFCLQGNHDEQGRADYIKTEIYYNILNTDVVGQQIMKMIDGLSEAFYKNAKASLFDFPCEDEDEFFFFILQRLSDTPEIQRFLDFHYEFFCMLRQS